MTALLHFARPPRAPGTIDGARVVAKAFRIWRRTLPQLLAVTALAYAPLLAVRYWLRDSGKATDWHGAVARALPAVEFFAIAAAVEALVVRMVFQRLRGDAIDLGRSIAVGSRRIGTVVGIATILNLPNFASMLREWSAETPFNLPAGLAIGAANIVVALVYCVATPAALVERRGVFAALRRSRELTRGNRWTIVVVNVLLVVVALLFVIATSLVDRPASGTAHFLYEAVTDVAGASFSGVLPIVLYHELREAKEGIGLEEIAAVFD